MKVMVSACLTGENCKYNGGNNRNEKILRLMADNDVITVCPEQMGGLPTPRVPAEIKDGVVTAGDGRIVDVQRPRIPFGHWREEFGHPTVRHRDQPRDLCHL